MSDAAATEVLDAQGRFFNPRPRVRLAPIGPGATCVVVDDALANPEGLRQWALAQRYVPPVGYAYPGHIYDLAGEINRRIAEFFARYAAPHLGVRRVQRVDSRVSVIDTPPQALLPVQWLCHRDRGVAPGSEEMFAASVLYLFHDASLGGTSFYAPRQGAEQTEALVRDSMHMDGASFARCYGVRPGYMAGSNDYFERCGQVGAAWNRMVFYDGGLFHSADVREDALDADLARGRLTLNSFITCRRKAR